MRYRFFSLFAIVFIFCGLVLSQEVFALNLDTTAVSTGLNGNNNFIYSLGGLSIGTSTRTANTLLLGTGGFKFSDGTTQTTAYLGSSQTVSAGNVSQGVFGYPNASNAFAFPAALAVGTTTYAGLPANGLYVAGSVGIGTTVPGSYKLNVNGTANFSDNITLTKTGDGIIGYSVTGDSYITYSNSFRLYNGGEKLRLSATGGLSLGSTYTATDPGAGNMIIQGNVGIGMTAPNRKLDVQNIVGVEDTTGTEKIYLYAEGGGADV
ncbi:MAG: hypothetical protein WC842_03940, partial [Candidatus Paceibacterota bacterium]